MSSRPRQNSEPVRRRPMWPNVTALIEGRHTGATSARATQADNPGGRVIAQHKCFAALFPGQIKTADELRDIAPTSAFVTLHTRTLPEDPSRCSRVTLALAPDLERAYLASQPTPALPYWAAEYGVQATCFRSAPRQSMRCLGPAAAPWGFSHEYAVESERLDGAVSLQMSLFRRTVPKCRQLVLVGAAPHDFDRLCAEFPGATKHFAKWVDLDALTRAAAPIPVRFWNSVERALQICDFLMRDRDAAAGGSASTSTSAMSGWRDQPACGAVAMLAVLSGFACRAQGEDDEDDDYEDGDGGYDSVSDYELLESDDMSEGDLLEDAVSEGEHTIWYGDAQGPTPPTRRRLTVIPDEEDVSIITVEDEEEH
ncbi:hypothetical protein ANO14919_055510 [Xylariales sp. No.14919]|nr:hypothetical protein ANO14919_055510 [Xylariales sp. No.14919]